MLKITSWPLVTLSKDTESANPPFFWWEELEFFSWFFFFCNFVGEMDEHFFFFSFIIGSVDFDENTLHSDYIYIILMINCHLKCVSFTYTTHIVAQLWILMFASTLVCNACYIYFFFYSYATLKIWNFI